MPNLKPSSLGLECIKLNLIEAQRDVQEWATILRNEIQPESSGLVDIERLCQLMEMAAEELSRSVQHCKGGLHDA